MSVHSPRVAVIVLNWNGLSDTRRCIDTLLAQRPQQPEIHVVDNGSDNAEAETLAAEFGDRIILHALDRNLGFAGGCNYAFERLLAKDRESPCEFIALLNNDAFAAPDWIAELVAEAERSGAECGAVASRMRLDSDPERLDGAGVWLLSNGDSTPRGRLDQANAWNKPQDVQSACGGAVLLRSTMLRAIGVFRTDFFANFEDMDLFLRAGVCGWRIRYAPAAEVRHRLNATIRKVRDHAFNVRSVRNSTWATTVNLPLPVLLLNLPWAIVCNVAIIVLLPLLGRPRFAAAFLQGRLRALGEWRAIARERRQLRPLRRTSWWRYWWAQRSFAIEYGRLLWLRLRRQTATPN